MGSMNNASGVFKAETLVFPTVREPEAGGLQVQVSPYSRCKVSSSQPGQLSENLFQNEKRKGYTVVVVCLPSIQGTLF